MDGVRIFGSLGSDRGDIDFVSDKEARVEAKTEGTNEVSGVGGICAALSFSKELGRS